ncbi:hypothetical protein Tco_0857951 [Tanacetum coccineum]|uniref:Uncharacterized protein n=1 Tax=Tanacetum coccineum TaxID=301880 RepID=A0ABQ5B9I3_9ASTR
MINSHSVSSTSAHHNYGSSSHQGDDDEDDCASCASTPSPTTYLNSFKPLNYQQYEIPSPSEQSDDILFERQTKLLNQSQEIHKEGFAAILAVLVNGASQSRQHGKSEPDSYYLSD